jgi:hypothetical protein
MGTLAQRWRWCNRGALVGLRHQTEPHEIVVGPLVCFGKPEGRMGAALGERRPSCRSTEEVTGSAMQPLRKEGTQRQKSTVQDIGGQWKLCRPGRGKTQKSPPYAERAAKQDAGHTVATPVTV